MHANFYETKAALLFFVLRKVSDPYVRDQESKISLDISFFTIII